MFAPLSCLSTLYFSQTQESHGGAPRRHAILGLITQNFNEL